MSVSSAAMTSLSSQLSLTVSVLFLSAVDLARVLVPLQIFVKQPVFVLYIFSLFYVLLLYVVFYLYFLPSTLGLICPSLSGFWSLILEH